MSITLTPEDIAEFKAIRRNTDWNVRYSLVADWRVGFGYALTVLEERKQPEGFDPPYAYRRYRFATEGRTQNYRGGDDIETTKRIVASAGQYISEEFDVPTALANVVRAGDVLTIRFMLGNDTDRMKEAGFTHDTCDIAVTRITKVHGGSERRTTIGVFRIDDIVSSNGYTMVDNLYRPERDGNVA